MGDRNEIGLYDGPFGTDSTNWSFGDSLNVFGYLREFPIVDFDGLGMFSLLFRMIGSKPVFDFDSRDA